MGKLRKLWGEAGTKGLRIPHAFDPATNQPSVRLWFTHLSFFVALCSVLALHFFPALLLATGVAVLFFSLNMIFYMLRSLTKAKIDLNDQSLDLESSPDSTGSEEKKEK